MNKASEDIRRACNVLATYHRDQGHDLTEITGKNNPVAIFITSNEEIKTCLRELTKISRNGSKVQLTRLSRAHGLTESI